MILRPSGSVSIRGSNGGWVHSIERIDRLHVVMPVEQHARACRWLFRCRICRPRSDDLASGAPRRRSRCCSDPPRRIRRRRGRNPCRPDRSRWTGCATARTDVRGLRRDRCRSASAPHRVGSWEAPGTTVRRPLIAEPAGPFASPRTADHLIGTTEEIRPAWQALIDRPDRRRPVGDAAIAASTVNVHRARRKSRIVATKHSAASRASRVRFRNRIVACRRMTEVRNVRFTVNNFIDEIWSRNFTFSIS